MDKRQGDKTLKEIGIDDGSTVHMLLHPKAQRQTLIEAAFKAFDTDGSGFLEPEEIRAILMRPGGGAPLTEPEADAEVKKFIDKYDKNGDGKLEIGEISNYLAERFWEGVEAGAA